MKLKCLGLSTELMLRSFESEVEDKSEYIAVRTPQNPGYRWGNFLIFRELPQAGDLERWKAVFAKEVGTPPVVNHYAFTWDSPTGEHGAAQEFLDAGYRLEETVVMTARTVSPPPKFNSYCQVRAFEGESDWREWLELALLQDAIQSPGRQEGSGYREFLEKKLLNASA